ncbi:MAG: leucyl aminopeptidase family protein [Bacteroidetes bacterium]|nr:leucyl aminopeptidase family protein [Bacteroidota bacterium]
MITQLKYTSSVAAKDDLIVIGNKTTNWKNFNLSDKEASYIKKKLTSSNSIIEINQYGKFFFAAWSHRGANKHESLESFRRLGNKIVGFLNKRNIRVITISSIVSSGDITLALAEGIALGNYQFLKYKTNSNYQANSLRTVRISNPSLDNKKVKNLAVIVEATCIARDLVNEHPTFLTASQLGREVKKLGKLAGFKTDVFNKSKIESLKMGGLLAVNRGSQEPPTFSFMEWKPRNAKNKKPIVLVGKGITYDTGGMSLKPTPNSMDHMKSDMAGSAAVICTMYAIAKTKMPVHVVGLVPSTDNRPSENAYVPGDVITMYDGTTVEVLNTDAEGRLVLADALSYAKKMKPELVIDLATLTGSAAKALGPLGIVFMGTADEKTKQSIKKSGNQVYERLAEFPLWKEYGEQLQSDIADLKNIGSTSAGAITAGKFLEHFTDYPWLHLDIAGVAFIDNADSYRGKNGTGVGVRLLFDYLQNIASNGKRS